MLKSILAGVFAVCLIAGATVGRTDGDWAYTPGQHHLSKETADSLYKQVVADYLKVHPDATVPPRSPKYGFATGKDLCTIMQMDPCQAPAAITCGEWGMCNDWPQDFDTIYDEQYDYETPFGRSVVYHEWWHILQFWNNGPIRVITSLEQQHRDLECRENEAYTYQIVWLRKHSYDIAATKVMNIMMRHPCRTY